MFTGATSAQPRSGEEGFAVGAVVTSTGANGEDGGGATSEEAGAATVAQPSEVDEVADEAAELTALGDAAAITGVNCGTC